MTVKELNERRMLDNELSSNRYNNLVSQLEVLTNKVKALETAFSSVGMADLDDKMSKQWENLLNYVGYEQKDNLK